MKTISEPARFNVLGVGVSALSLDDATQSVLAPRDQKQLGYICVCTVHGVSEARRDPALLDVFNHSYLTAPDGMPLVWLGIHHAHKDITRICDEGRVTKLRHYFYGGDPGAAELLSDKLYNRFLGLEIVGTYTPPYRPLDNTEFAEIKRDMDEKSPDVIWAGLSTPKQELFMADVWDKLDTGF